MKYKLQVITYVYTLDHTFAVTCKTSYTTQSGDVIHIFPVEIP